MFDFDWLCLTSNTLFGLCVLTQKMFVKVLYNKSLLKGIGIWCEYDMWSFCNKYWKPIVIIFYFFGASHSIFFFPFFFDSSQTISKEINIH
jgi:hypothetical protein